MSREPRFERPFTVWINNFGWGIHGTFKTEAAALERAQLQRDYGWDVLVTVERRIDVPQEVAS